MPGPRSHLKRGKRKHSAKASRKAAASSKRKRTKSSDAHSPQQSSPEVADGSCEAEGQKASPISGERHHLPDRRRSSASSEPEGPEGKENELRAEMDGSGNRIQDKPESDEETDKTLFPDDDSNQILPVEQFFGNMETVQDVPRRNPATSARVRKENRRRHFYASDDTDE